MNSIATKCAFCDKEIFRYPSRMRPRNFCTKEHFLAFEHRRNFRERDNFYRGFKDQQARRKAKIK